MKLLLASVIALALFLACLIVPAFAQSSTSLDTNAIVVALLPSIAWIILSILGLVALWLAKLLKDKWGWDITAQVAAVEANNRDALHSAVLTGLGAAVHELGPEPEITSSSPAGQLILQTVKASVPEAVTALGATDDWIIKAAQSKLQLHGAPALLPMIAGEAIQTGAAAPVPMPLSERPAAAG